MTLALTGNASFAAGFDDRASHVVRLRSPKAPRVEGDVAIIKNTADLQAAELAGFDGFAFVGAQSEGAASSLPGRALGLPSQFDYLQDGDVLGLRGNGKKVRTLYRRNSNHNAFLVTERCDHYCLMCSQPPRDVDDRWILDEIGQAIPLIDRATQSLGFSGGEPLLEWQPFTDLLSQCRTELPDTAVHVLSNGRAFARNEVSDAWASVNHPDLMVGIPVYSAVNHIHDYVVQAEGAFEETVLGILKLKDRKQRVEVRVVLHSITAPRIVETARWFARNLPFVDHVALMGLENTGFAIANDKMLWIDPLDYKHELAEAVDILSSAEVPVSVYNVQRCVLEPAVWPYAVKSISDWKNNYLEACEGCVERESCAGFFSSGRPRHSRGINALTS